MLWSGGLSVVWISIVAVVCGELVVVVGRWRVVVEWRGEVRVWRRVSMVDLVGVVVGMAAKLYGDVGGLNEKGRLAAERVLWRLLRKCWREATWDWCWRCSTTGFSRA